MLKPPCTASLSQIRTLYTFVWKEMATSRKQVVDALSSTPFIFVPYDFVKFQEDIVIGIFLSPKEVYWHDSTGALDHILDGDTSERIASILSTNKKKWRKKKNSVQATSIHLCKALSCVYPSLHDFFVLDCGVSEAPSVHHYLQILQQLSRITLPAETADVVFRILLGWSDGLKHGTLQNNDMTFLKECLCQLEYSVLPSTQNKWVSLHSSFGLVCWCDDDNLKKEFDHLDSIVVLYSGEVIDYKKHMIHVKLSALLRSLGIPSLSEVVSRDAIYVGLADSTIKTMMLEWVLQFAQCYIYNLHPDKYSQLKLTEFNQLRHLKIVVVEKLLHRNVIKRCDCTSQLQNECSSLLQGNILYTTRESDLHSVFMEFSRLLFDGATELHFANFLHMIIVMSESGLSETQIKVFLLNSQKMVVLPSEESVWSLSAALSSLKNDVMLSQSACSTDFSEQFSCESAKQPVFSSCHTACLGTASASAFSCKEGIRTQDVITNHFADLGTTYVEGVMQEKASIALTEITEPDSTDLPSSESSSDSLLDLPGLCMEAFADPTDMVELHYPEDIRLNSTEEDQLLPIISGPQQAMLTGRQGELVAFQYFAKKAEGAAVKWVNQEKETGLPYDIIIEKEESREYIEVKASRYARKNWVGISTKEWQFAAEKGDKFTIAHVILSGHNLAKLVVYKNPIKLCQSGKLQLAVMTPRWCKDLSK